jgi:putative IMPACT (imprinted ancient) family translation regulator
MERVPKSRLDVVIDYSSITQFKRLLPEYEAEILQEEYAADATFAVELPSEHVASFTEGITTLTNGLALIEVISEK